MLKRTLTLFTLLVSTTVFADPGLQAKIDQQSRIITKLHRVHVGLKGENATKAKVALRLADLHAERSRLLSMQTLSAENEVLAKSDREKALYYYKNNINSVDKGRKAPVLVQMGHLYELMGDDLNAKNLYEQASTHPSEYGAEANLSIAEIYFRKKNYRSARKYYEKAISNAQFKRKGLAEFRLSWCQYYMGELAAAVARVEKMLNTPSLLSRSGVGQDVQVDDDFHAEISNDYVRFLVDSGKMQASKIARLYELSPASQKERNLMYLAKELERLGQQKMAVEAWNVLISKTNSAKDRTTAHVYLTQLNAKLGKRAEVVAVMKDIEMTGRDQLLCQQEFCKEMLRRFEKVIFDWHKAEKKALSKELLEGYAILRKITPSTNVKMLSVEVAQGLKEYARAFQWNREVIDELKAAPDKSKELEQSLLRHIEIAELQKNPESLASAQTLYLGSSKSTKKKADVRYQQVYGLYEAGNYQEASQGFYEIALGTEGTKALRAKSADLALDSLALLKKHDLIGDWSAKLIQAFPEKRADLEGIRNKAVLSKAASLVNTVAAKAGTDWSQVYTSLKKFDEKSAKGKELTNFYRNMIVASKNLKKAEDVYYYSNALAKQPGISQEDRKFALTHLVWHSELILDFKSAYVDQKKLNTFDVKKTNWLKMALFAELSGKPNQQYLAKHLQLTKEKSEKLVICQRMSKGIDSWKAIHVPCKSIFKQNPIELSSLLFDMYSRTGSPAIANVVKREPALKGSGITKFFARADYWKSFEKTLAPGKKLNIDSSLSQEKLIRVIQKRGKYLNRLEKTVGKAVDADDWLIQVVALGHLKNEMERMYNDLAGIQAPAEFTPEEKEQFTALLLQQAEPYQVKAIRYGEHFNKLWESPVALGEFEKSMSFAKGAVKKQLISDISRLNGLAPEAVAPRVTALVETAVEAPVRNTASTSSREIEALKSKIRKSPFITENLVSLKALEETRKNTAMVEYLESRINSEKNPTSVER